MIAFITRNSNLVPLLKGLCSSHPCKFELLVFWGFAGNTAHVGDLYQAADSSFLQPFCLFSLLLHSCNQRLLVTGPSQHSCFFSNFCHPLEIVHPRPGSRHVLRPCVVMILVYSTRSSHTCDDSRILTKAPAGISWCRNQFFPITSGVSCSRRSPGSYAAVGIEGASHRMLLRMSSEPFLSIGLLTM